MPGLHVSEDSTLGCRAVRDQGTCFWRRGGGRVGGGPVAGDYVLEQAD